MRVSAYPSVLPNRKQEEIWEDRICFPFAQTFPGDIMQIVDFIDEDSVYASLLNSSIYFSLPLTDLRWF